MTRMMRTWNPRKNAPSFPYRSRWLMYIGLCVTLAGCGTSRHQADTPPPQDDQGAKIVTPTDAVASTDPPAPGGLELPPGAIPSASTQTGSTSASVATGGIEMPTDVAVPVESAGETSSVTTPAIEFATWEQIQATARSTGRITVVDLWSLACEPCLKEFPGLVALHQSMGTTVQCMAVDLDYDGRKSRPPETYRQEVIAFLQSVGAEGFPLFISTTPSDDVFAAAKLSSIPAVLVFDAKGELVKAFVDAGDTAGFTYEKDIVPFVSKLAG